MQILVSWLQKPTDPDLHCFQRHGIAGFSMTRVNIYKESGKDSLSVRVQNGTCSSSETSPVLTLTIQLESLLYEETDHNNSNCCSLLIKYNFGFSEYCILLTMDYLVFVFSSSKDIVPCTFVLSVCVQLFLYIFCACHVFDSVPVRLHVQFSRTSSFPKRL